MTVAATGDLGLLISAIRTMVAKSSVWQTWTGTANETAAKARVAFGLEPSPGVLSPNALVGLLDGGGNKVSGGAQDFHDQSTDVLLAFTADVPEAYATKALAGEAYLDFLNHFEGVMAEVLALCGTPGYPTCQGWKLMQPPVRVFPEDAEFLERSGEDALGNFHEVALVMHLGVS